jgi:hypothetical protein
MTLISTTTLAVDGTIDVSSIPNTYNDLILVAIIRGTAAGNDGLALRFNNDSAGNYSWERIQASAATVSAFEPTLTTAQIDCGSIPAASGTANSFAVSTITVYGYNSTTWLKSVTWENFSTLTIVSGGPNVRRGGGTWLSTATINRVTLFGAGTANLLTGSQLRIYGRL